MTPHLAVTSFVNVDPDVVTANPFGHFVLIGPEPSISESWTEYISVNLGLDLNEIAHRSYVSWITDSNWEPSACTMLGMSASDGGSRAASKRIKCLLERGIPDLWNSVGDLMFDDNWG
jgi:hypothetical protein